jgi:transcriptional regulator with XRE-family HTH domain
VTDRYCDRVRGVTEVSGERLKALICQDGRLSVREAARRLGVTESRLRAWFTERVGPEPSVLRRILTDLDKDILDVLPMGTRETLRVLRWRAGLTVEELRDETDISRRRWERLEEGEVLPTKPEAEALARALNTSVEKVHTASGGHAQPVTVPIQVAAEDLPFLDAFRRAGESRSDAASRAWGTAVQILRSLGADR